MRNGAVLFWVSVFGVYGKLGYRILVSDDGGKFINLGEIFFLGFLGYVAWV